MTQFTKILILALALSPLAAFAGTPIDVKISGMTCGSCVKSVTEALSKLEGIEKESLKVELKGTHATLSVVKNEPKTMDAIKAAVKQAGFEVIKIDVLKN